jgi:DNA repair protein RecO (recombination protein O)
VAGAAGGRVVGAEVFVLHTYPYRETSLIVEALARGHGRIAWVARGARRPGSSLRGRLLPFQPLLAGWGGRGELRTLHRLEWLGGYAPLQGTALVCGMYLNELLLRLLRREDPHEGLYDAYAGTLATLGAGRSLAPALRLFERELLREIGYGLLLDREAEAGDPIVADRRYRYVIGRGAVPASASDEGIELAGSTLLDLAAGRLDHPGSLQESRSLMRAALAQQLGEQPLHTRELLRALLTA